AHALLSNLRVKFRGQGQRPQRLRRAAVQLDQQQQRQGQIRRQRGRAGRAAVLREGHRSTGKLPVRNVWRFHRLRRQCRLQRFHRFRPILLRLIVRLHKLGKVL
ncbi:unnamed protein product, partial [Phaeothamnion confervicola]